MVAQDDGLPTRDAGPWTKEKLWFWHRYIEITTSAMVGKPQWSGGLVYVDLFAGPGVCSVRETGRRFPGSVLIAANAPKPFRKILACELDEANAEACETRLRRVAPNTKDPVFRGDCNERIGDIAKQIPAHSLTLAFIDPEALHVHFDTLRTLTHHRRVDLLVLWPDRMDILRNVDSTYASQADSKLDKELGPDCNWRRRWIDLPNQNPLNACNMFTELFKQQLARHLGYEVFRHKTIPTTGRPLYRLIFASKHPRGAEFWDKITGKDIQGQLDFKFD